jgi:DNA-directed RNA polymerase specialized sigma24 family protein
MSELSRQQAGRKRDWALSPRAFQHLLRWLDEGVDSCGEKYLEAQRRLVAYFDRKNCPAPDDLADEALNRVARRLEEEGAIEGESPARYCYIVARFVFLEYARAAPKAAEPFDEASPRQRVSVGVAAAPAGDEGEAKEAMLDCLGGCVEKLEPPAREIITRYYVGTGRMKIENRRALAEELGITANALSIRACRIRDKLEDCVRRCVGARRNTFPQSS